MKTVSSSLAKISITFILSFFTLFFVHAVSTHAIGIGLTDDAPIMGLTCGNPNATDDTRKCCVLPGEKELSRGQFRIFGEVNPLEDKTKKKSLWQRVAGTAGTVLKLGTISTPTGILTSIATGNFGDVARGIIDAMFKAGVPLMTSVAEQQADQLGRKITGDAISVIDDTKSVDYQCDTSSGFADTTTEPGKCICKPFGERSMDPNAVTYVNWHKWVLAKVSPERQYAVAQVLGATTLAATPKFTTAQERADLLKSCSEIIDDFDRRTCIRQGLAVEPKFLNTCNRIKDPNEQEQCKQCVVGGAESEYSSNYGESIQGVWTGVGCIPSDLGKFMGTTFLPWSIGIGGGVAMLVLMYASYLYATSRGAPDKLKKARDYLNSGLIGLLVIIFSVFILQLLGLTILRIPGIFGGGT